MMDLVSLRQNTPILEVAARLGLTVKNNRLHCFFPEHHSHGDRTPSVSVNTERNSFKCWVCPEVKGSVIDLVMLSKGIDFKGALEFLRAEGFVNDSSQHSIPPPRTNGMQGTPVRNVERPPPLPVKPAIDQEQRTAVYTQFLSIASDLSPVEIRFLKGRRIYQKTAKKMGLRCIDNYSRISEALEKAFSNDVLVNSGLYNAKGHLRFYKHTLLIPYWVGKEVVFFQARATDPEVTPKELNPKGTIPKPYNCNAIERNPILYLCEGAIDTMTLIEQGFAAVGIPGASNFKPEWVSLFKDKRVYSVLDADTAGEQGNLRLRELFSAASIFFEVISLPKGLDVNDMFTGKAWKK